MSRGAETQYAKFWRESLQQPYRPEFGVLFSRFPRLDVSRDFWLVSGPSVDDGENARWRPVVE